MKLNQAENLALQLMEQHHLLQKGWTFKFDSAKARLGKCNYTAKVISISRYMTEADTTGDTVSQTLLHEIAHAILPIYDQRGVKIGHGPIWKAKAASIGYTGKRLALNPYVSSTKKPQRNNKTTTKSKGTKKKPVPKRKPIAVKPTFKVGDIIRIPDQRIALIVKVARTRYHIDIGGKLYSIPFGAVTSA